MSTNKTPLERFWSKVDKRSEDECWPWIAGRNRHGYGKFGTGGLGAHRFAWELTHGPIPKGEGYHGTCVLHRCDVRHCVNPAHLFLGTCADNIRDMRDKGRGSEPPHSYGEKNHNAKLTAEAAQTIRLWKLQGKMSNRKLAAFFGVSHCVIGRIVNGTAWKQASPAGETQ